MMKAMMIPMVVILSIGLNGCITASTALLIIDSTLTVAKLANEVHLVKKNLRETETWDDPGLELVENTEVAMARNDR